MSESQAVATNQRAYAILRGQEPPPNKYAEFIVKKHKERMEDLDKVRRAAAQARQALTQYEMQEVRLVGVLEQYAQDMMQWLQPEAEVPPPPVPSDAPAVKNGADAVPPPRLADA